jgi:predicted N-acetyltransferase YhbS
MSIQIEHLADHPELTHLLAIWFFEEWGRHNRTLTVESIEQRVRERMNQDKLPLTLVAFLETEPVASATLKIREMETHPQFEHWLGNVYVRSEYRNRGIGSHIIESAAEEAKRLDVQDLYLFTRDRERLYARLGWKMIERAEYHGRIAVIMKRELVEAQASPAIAGSLEIDTTWRAII